MFCTCRRIIAAAISAIQKLTIQENFRNIAEIVE
jgi:hypothetical protein